jgi:hypothetical protein
MHLSIFCIEEFIIPLLRKIHFINKEKIMGHYVSIHSGSSIDEATTRIYNVSPGIATASKAIVLDENKDVSGIRNITCAGGILLSGSISASNRLAN